MLKPPVSLVIRVEDQDGKPVAGARVREMTQRGVNGECPLRQLWMRSLGVSIPPSDEQGCLRLPPLPSGEIIKATIEHPRLAPVRTGDLTVAPGATATVKMQPGVAVTLHVPVDPPAERIPSAVVDLRHEPFDDPSTILYYEVEFDPKGTAQLTVAPGDYSWFLLQHENFFLTPVYSANHQKKNWLRIESGRNQDLHIRCSPESLGPRPGRRRRHRKAPVQNVGHGRTGPPHAAWMGRSAPGQMELRRMGRNRYAGAIHDGPCRRARPRLLSGKRSSWRNRITMKFPSPPTVQPSSRISRSVLCRRSPVSCRIPTALPPPAPSFDSAASTSQGSSRY